jgi:TolA-binding protein
VQARLLRDRNRQRTALETLIEKHGGSALAPVAQFEVAAVLADDHETELALARFDAMLKQHPKHRLAPRALEAIGDLQAQALHRADLAVTSYERLLVEYPDDLFLDGVRKKLLAARAAKEAGGNATP